MTLYARLAAIAAILALSFGSGWKVASWRAQAAQNEAVASAIAATALQMTKDQQAALESMQAQDKTRVVYRTIRSEVSHAKIADCDLGAEFMGLWNRANQAAIKAPAVPGHGPVPGTGDAGKSEP